MTPITDLDMSLMVAEVENGLPGHLIDKELVNGYDPINELPKHGIRLFFQNGYGVSVQQILGTDTLLELCPLYGDRRSFCLTFKTPVTRDVMPCLSPSEAAELAVKIAQLRPNARALTR